MIFINAYMLILYCVLCTRLCICMWLWNLGYSAAVEIINALASCLETMC